LTDQRIWEAIQELTERTAWPTPAVIDAVVLAYGIDRDRVAQVWRERSFTTGAG
jgi:hypothetical protein